jgi:hypothetical protein
MPPHPTYSTYSTDPPHSTDPPYFGGGGSM